MSYATDVLSALDYIHKSGVVHDDIKLDNILLKTNEREDEYDDAKLCDFGLSQKIDPSIGKAYLEVKCGT